MKYPYSRKTWLWLLFASLKKKIRKGAMTLITAFIFFVFSAIGLSLLYLSQIHLRISSFKKQSILLEYASENGIKQGFNHFLTLLAQAPSPCVLSPDELLQLREDVSSGSKILEKALDLKEPISISGNWKQLYWESSINWLLDRITEKDSYFKAIFKVSFDAEGMINDFHQKRKTQLTASLHILGGQIPLPLFPLFLNKKLKPEEKFDFSDKNKISISSSEQSQFQPKISFSEEELIPVRADTELAKALKMKLFHPQDLSLAELRALLRLDESEEPVPDGVYLIKDNSGLGGIYVQGDVDELIMAIHQEYQIIAFQTQQGRWILKFSPSKGKTFFTSPEEAVSYDLLPLGIIVINGQVESMGGGVVSSSGEVIMVKDEKVPSVLSGVQLTFISSDKITLSSHLIVQGVKWQKGIPYLKDSDSRLTIFSTGKDFWDNTTREGGIAVDESSPEEIQIHASLTASGKGFAIEGEGKKAQILGSLQATDYKTGNNSLNMIFDDRLQEKNNFLENTPLTTKPILFISYFKALEWEEF